MSTFTMTMMLLSLDDSLIPITSTVEISATIKTAGTLTSAPVRLSPEWAHPARPEATSLAVHQAVGEFVSVAGRVMLKWESSDTKCPDHPTATVEAPAAYSSTRSQPMIQATSSPIVAYE